MVFVTGQRIAAFAAQRGGGIVGHVKFSAIFIADLMQIDCHKVYKVGKL